MCNSVAQDAESPERHPRSSGSAPTHETMSEVKDMMQILQALLKDIRSVAEALHEEVEKFVTGNVREIKEVEGSLQELLKLLRPLDGLIRNGNDIGTRSLGELAKVQVSLDESAKFLKAELPKAIRLPQGSAQNNFERREFLV